jgi:hypothetical protein
MSITIESVTPAKRYALRSTPATAQTSPRIKNVTADNPEKRTNGRQNSRGILDKGVYVEDEPADRKKHQHLVTLETHGDGSLTAG